MGKQVRLYQAFETARVLLLSGRVPPVETWKCGGWEFEQSILSLEDAERFAPHQSAMGRFLQRPVRGIARYAPQVRHFQFGPGKPPLQKKYELAFATVGSLGDLLALGPPRAWRHKCDIAICNIDDFFLPYLSILKDQIRILEDFDIIYCCCAGSVQALSDRLNKPVMYLPPAVDTLRFLPTRPFDQRAVDVTSIGRRSREEHDALLQYADRTGSFYYYDSISAPKLWSNEPGEHRALLARIIGNSRFFITNHANFDRPDKSAGQEEIGFRFFEGAAAGAVLVGAPRLDALRFDPVVVQQPQVAAAKLLRIFGRSHGRAHSVRLMDMRHRTQLPPRVLQSVTEALVYLLVSVTSLARSLPAKSINDILE